MMDERTDLAAYRAERDRQTQIIAQAISDVIGALGHRLGNTPMLNAVAGALVTVEADMLASIETRDGRRAIKKAMDEMRPLALKAAMQRNQPSSRIITVGERTPH